MPTSSSEPIRPRKRMRPSVGSVTRESTFRNVLLPAPFRPINPTTSPSATSKEMSFSAQNVRGLFVRLRPKSRAGIAARTSRRDL